MLRFLLLAGLAFVSGAIALLLPPSLGLDLEGGLHLVFEVDAPERDLETAYQAREVIARRLDAMNVSGASVVSQGSRVHVELLGADAAQLSPIRAALTRSAVLELVAIDDDWRPPTEPPLGLDVESDAFGPLLVARGPGARERLATSLPSMPVPVERRLAIGRDEGEAWRAYALDLDGGLAGHVVDARVMYAQPLGEPVVVVDFDGEGRRLLAELSRREVGRRIAIVLDGEVVSAPTVSAPITAGTAQITLGAAEEGDMAALQDAYALTAALRSGSLPAPMALEQETIVASAVPRSTQLVAHAASLAAWLVIAIVAAIRWRVRGALWVLSGVPVVVLGWVASTAVFGGVVTTASWTGLLIICAATLLTGMIHLELAPRGRLGGLLAMMGTHAALFMIACAIHPYAEGFTRGLTAGVCFAVPAALCACLFGATALAEPRAPAPPITRRS